MDVNAQEGEGSGSGEPHAEPPFSAEILRESMSVGESWEFRLLQPPEPPMTLMMRVLSVNDEGMEVETRVINEAGENVAAPTARFSSWDGLESHGHYPASVTRVEPTEVTVAAGTFPAVSYHTVQPDESLLDATFATELPGPPVLYVVTMDGVETMRMELLSHTEGDAAAGE